MLKSPQNYILVQMDTPFQETIQTQSGVTLYQDTTYNPEWKVSCIGKVVAAPRKLPKRIDLKGLDIEVKEGDEIIFSYMVVFEGTARENDTFHHENLFFFEGQYYWKVDYYHYLGKVVNGKIIPAQGYVFLEPVEEKREEKIGLIYLPEMTVKEKVKGKARVVGVGKPKKGEKVSVKEGDIARFNDRFAMKYDIKGKNYIVLHQDQIAATES